MLFRKQALRLANSDIFFLALILLASFGVRCFQIGHDSLWNDETGVVLAALTPSYKDTIKAARTHAMAMPLDYLLIRLITRISLHETVLRLPSAIFGVLTLAVCYNYFKILNEERVALLAVLMLAFSPLHVMYSQEVRFYSSFLFFYYLSTNLLLAAIAEAKKLTKWGLFLLTYVTGAYFHIFVLFSIVNGFTLAFIRPKKETKIALLYLLISAFTAFLAVLPGYLYFGSHQKFNYPLLLWTDSLFKEIARGVGWHELPFVSRPNLGSIWYLICLLLFLAGLGTIASQFSKELIALLVSGVLQILLVISADLIKGYWFSYRQLLFLHPAALLLSSFGLHGILNAIRRIAKLGNVFIPVLIGMLILINFLSLRNYFVWSKSEARELSKYIIANWSPTNDAIFVAPGYQEKVYRFYLQYIFERPDIAIRVKPAEINESFSRSFAKDAFLIVIGNPSEQVVSYLLQTGFSPLKISKAWLGHSLFAYCARHRP